MKLPEFIVEEFGTRSEQTSLFGVQLKDLSHAELMACICWMESTQQQMRRQEMQSSIDRIDALVHRANRGAL